MCDTQIITNMCVFTCMLTHIYKCMFTCACSHVHVRVHMFMFTCACSQSCSHKYTHTYTLFILQPFGLKTWAGTNAVLNVEITSVHGARVFRKRERLCPCNTHASTCACTVNPQRIMNCMTHRHEHTHVLACVCMNVHTLTQTFRSNAPCLSVA